MAYFRCKKKFKRVGPKIAVCLSSGTWSQQTPVCVGRGCPDLGTLPDLTITELYKGGILEFQCAAGMRREGPQKLMCDGTNWDNEPPKCLYGISLGCDFEDPGLCGWSQDENDDFDWTWTSGGTPTTDTGPDGDHTTGSGHYIFMESSAPQKSGQVTRLISPPYQPTDDMCMNFFYHMKGPSNPGGQVTSTPEEDSFPSTTNADSDYPDEYSGWSPGSSESPDYTDSDEDSGQSEGEDDDDDGQEPGVGNQRSTGGPSAADYLPLIVGVTLGLAVGMVVVGALAMMWARNRRKQKERQVEEDQMNIIGSIEGNPYTTYASEH
nr:hypothetical protein BaRGS_028427 [Batillaria attramentaria]